MTMYHRGKVRSQYRKRYQTVALAGTSTGQLSTKLLTAPDTGILEAKSIRARVAVLMPVSGSGTAERAGSGWIGYARYVDNTSVLNSRQTAIANSEIFGIQPWIGGGETIYYMDLNLKGITLSHGESFYLVAEIGYITRSNSVQLLWSGVYAEHEVPA
jgi:hypothetical protein